jgi:hypothetical protein
MALVAVVLVLLAGVLWGCGSDHPSSRTARAPESAQRAGGERGESEQGEREALRRLPARDRLAYFHLATAAGVLSEDASIQISSRKTPAHRSERLAKLRQQVAGLRPADPLLRALRARLLSLIDRALAAGTSRGSASSQLTDAIAIVRGLERYARQHPAVSALVPE